MAANATQPLPSGQHHADAPPRWSNFPVAATALAAARIGPTVFAGLGGAGTGWYALDTTTAGAGWKTLAPFPDAPRNDARAVAVGQKIYVFGGAGRRTPDDPATIAFDTGWCYDPVADTWTLLPTRPPFGVLGAAVVALDEDDILFFGGVNKVVFDGYFRDHGKAADDIAAHQARVTRAYLSRPPVDYFFTTQVLRYHVPDHTWHLQTMDPGAATVGAGLAVCGDEITLVSGEIKPGLRALQMKSITVREGRCAWRHTPLPEQSDGLAAACTGYSGGALLVAGGTNFPGSWARFRQGHLWAHEGLRKTWHEQVHALVDGQWRDAGKLPWPLAQAACIQLDDSILVIGGERQDGIAVADVVELRWCAPHVQVIR